jgi:hypothetical protein
VLPAWSWIFDYVRPDSQFERPIVGVYSPIDPEPDGTKGKQSREIDYYWPPAGTFNWPPPKISDGTDKYRMKIKKFARQGFYDNIHIHPTEATPHFTEAPFCSDLCMHCHWRWGVLAIPGPDPYSFLGWGDGTPGGGGHTAVGGPLIPPNQHLDIDVKRDVNVPGAIGLGYQVRVMKPSPNQTQVLFEQGVAFSFSYTGSLRPIDIVRFAVAMNVVDGPDFDSVLDRLIDEQKNKPDVFDADVRNIFHEIYAQLQFYHMSVDDMKAVGVQQIPDGRVPDPTQPNSKPPEEL